jgi:hypothetical protein
MPRAAAPGAVPAVPVVPVVPADRDDDGGPDEEPGSASDPPDAAAAARVGLPEGATLHVSAAEASRDGLDAEEWALVWEGGRHVIDRRAILIGRGRDCDVVLADGNASRRHAELVRQGSEWVVRDLDSTNGTAVNGKRIRQAPVAAGDVITIGTTALELQTKGG